MDIPLLITLVEGCPHLYDKQRKDFRDRQKRDNSWREISGALGQSVEECQRVWRNLRERYVRERKTENPNSGAAQVEISWIYFYNMRFLEKHITSRKTTTNIQTATVTNNQAKNVDVLQMRTWDSLSEILVDPEADEMADTQSEYSSERTSEGEDGRESRNSSTAGTSQASVSDDDNSNNMTVGREQVHISTKPAAKCQQIKRKRNSNCDIEGNLTAAINNISQTLQNESENANSSDMAFGRYVGFQLMEMPRREKSRCKIKIMELLNEVVD